MFFDLTNSGNLSGFITLWLTPYAIGWLLLILLLFGVTKAVRPNERVAAKGDDGVTQDS